MSTPDHAPPTADEAQPLTECPATEVVCSQDYDPSFCTAQSYEGRDFPESLIVRAWGTNICAGRVALAKEACARGFNPSGLGVVQCVPDASGGNCPAASVVCGEEEEPTLCTAGTYGDQKLASGQLKAWGLNPCLARAALAATACSKNLNPIALGDVQCGVDPQGGECPPMEAFCKDSPREATCEAKKLLGRPLTTPLTTRGNGSCEANQRLLRLACSQGIKPSDIEDIVCRFGK